MYVKPFQKVRMELVNGLIFYYYTPHTSRVTQLRLIVVPVKFRLVVMSSRHVYPLALHIYEQRT